MTTVSNMQSLKNAIGGVFAAAIRDDAIANGMHVQEALVLDLALSLAKGLAEDASDENNRGRMALLRDALNDALNAEKRTRRPRTPQVSW